MRHIQRGEPLADFQHFVEKEQPDDWTEDFVKAFYGLYEICRKTLLEEQGGISGYTELPLEKDIHIDHFRKRSLYPKRAQVFDWYNLIVAEKDKPYGAAHKDEMVRRCEDYDLLINPVAEDPHSFFTYQANGNMVPRVSLSKQDRERANFTIKAFDLNHEFLRRKRLDLMMLVEDYRKGGLDWEDMKISLAGYGFPSVLEEMEVGGEKGL